MMLFFGMFIVLIFMLSIILTGAKLEEVSLPDFDKIKVEILKAITVIYPRFG